MSRMPLPLSPASSSCLIGVAITPGLMLFTRAPRAPHTVEALCTRSWFARLEML